MINDLKVDRGKNVQFVLITFLMNLLRILENQCWSKEPPLEL